MELKIMTPLEPGMLPEIKWNNEELKGEIASKASEYNSIAYTDKDTKDMKQDRATINKLISAFDDTRKTYKKIYLSPYEKFEKEIKDVLEPAVSAEKLLAAKIKEVEEQRRIKKKKEIEELFETIGFQNFVKLESIMDDKWLNASVTISQIETAMHNSLYRIGDDIFTIKGLPEFSFEAMEIYKNTLDISAAIREGQRLSDIQKRKLAHEEEQKKKADEAKRQEEASQISHPQQAVQSVEPVKAVEQSAQPIREQQEKLYTVDFRVEASKEKLELLKNFFRLNNITYGPVPKKGE